MDALSFDALSLHALSLSAMMRAACPKRFVEVGSGWSSGVVLDTNERSCDGAVELTLVDPRPARLRSLLTAAGRERVAILDEPVQDVDLSVFRSREAGDILFVDSSHVSEVGSDVNHRCFHVLPIRASAVIVHVHDVFLPFEPPSAWFEADVPRPTDGGSIWLRRVR